jgi:hypothetical protein
MVVGRNKFAIVYRLTFPRCGIGWTAYIADDVLTVIDRSDPGHSYKTNEHAEEYGVKARKKKWAQPSAWTSCSATARDRVINPQYYDCSDN